MPQWILETAAGSFWIVVGPQGQYALGLGERILGLFASPQEAARLLTRRKARDGQGGRRKRPSITVPADLTGWHFQPT